VEALFFFCFIFFFFFFKNPRNDHEKKDRSGK